MLVDIVTTRSGQPPAASLYVHDLPREQMPRSPQKGAVRTEVAVIGAGITGLVTALYLGRHGIDCRVLEANEPGWGASGRNGGQINPGLKTGPKTVAQLFGERAMRRVQGSADAVFELVGEERIECEIRRGGTLRAATDRQSLAELQALAKEARDTGIDYRMLSSDAVAAVTGSARYVGGLLDPSGGQVNPLKYTLGIADAVQRAGIPIHCNTPALRARETQGLWRIETPEGEVTADRILFATNGYTDGLVPGLRWSVLPVFSSILASRPLPQEWRDRILADGQSCFEVGPVTTYYRVDSNGRLIFGGRGRMRDADGPGAFPQLETLAETIWPGIGAVGWEYGWNGRVALTADHYPHVHHIGKNGYACLGYNGRGVAMATVMGQEMAALLVRGETPILPFSKPSSIPFQPFWPSGVAPALAWAKIKAKYLRRQ
ncbi:glycine/D-amino acid oxidase-like deaminating enzyme [Neorhizobium galegae]|uniref:NAD(P)/FAD-dependent oxidoreductase n=1 Tax=Neorhizobium galegae TaxID=399 RepID=UPI0027820DBB|nr:FAD-dependent oxidoreductase [Neorhizobium galegae]MDQ0134123.1 glycine/D-amino acid oxidase-like deaminating enzyme [Neorhizobium galegae]